MIIMDHGQKNLIIFKSPLQVNTCPLETEKKLKLLCEWCKGMIFMNMHALQTKRNKKIKRKKKEEEIFSVSIDDK